MSLCSACGEGITDIALNAFGMQWHPTCLGCKVCGKDFSDGSRVEEGEDGFAYCRKCFVDTFAPKCGGCGEPIMGQVINAINKQWHPEHFVCGTCKCSLQGAFFPGQDGIPYCEKHYYESMGLLCAECDKPIVSGKCIPFGQKKYHPEHFNCSFCKKNMVGQAYKQEKGKPYCTKCHLQLYG